MQIPLSLLLNCLYKARTKFPQKDQIIYERPLPPCWQQSGGILVLVSVTTEWFLSAQPSSEKCTGQEISGLFSNSGVSLLLFRLTYA